MSPEPRRQSLLVVRVGLEEESAAPVRIHLRGARDVGRGYDEEAYFTTIDAACEAARLWLESIVRPAIPG